MRDQKIEVLIRSRVVRVIGAFGGGMLVADRTLGMGTRFRATSSSARRRAGRDLFDGRPPAPAEGVRPAVEVAVKDGPAIAGSGRLCRTFMSSASAN